MDKNLSTTNLDLFPQVTGVLVSNYRRYQLNVRVNAGKSGDTFLPVLWVDLVGGVKVRFFWGYVKVCLASCGEAT